MDDDREEDDDEKIGLLPPLLDGAAGAEPPATRTPPRPGSQHAVGEEAPEHTPSAESPPSGAQHVPGAPSAQRQSPDTTTQRAQAPESAGPTTPDAAAQHAMGAQVATQHVGTSFSPPTVPGMQHAAGPLQPGEPGAQHGGQQQVPSRFRRMLEWGAKRPRGTALVGAAVIGVAIAATVIVVAQSEPDRGEVAAADPPITAAETTTAPERTAATPTTDSATSVAPTTDAPTITDTPEVIQASNPVGPPTTVLELPPVPDAACASEASFRSASGDDLASLLIVNNTGETLQSVWLDYEGQRVPYEQIAPHTSFEQPTWLTHPWIVADLQGTCYRLVVVDSLAQTVTVDPG